MSQMTYVFAHELGHVLGAEHPLATSDPARSQAVDPDFPNRQENAKGWVSKAAGDRQTLLGCGEGAKRT